MHVPYPLTYLPDEQDGIKLGQIVVVINDAVEELPSIHTAGKEGGVLSHNLLMSMCFSCLSLSDSSNRCVGSYVSTFSVRCLLR